MSLRRKREAPDPPAGLVGDHADKLRQVRPIFHDDDERQSAADRGTYHSPFQSAFEPVPLPRWLKPRKPKNRA
ncbi:MAG TPA: hypothetical protein VFY32_13430 [Solirubrobacteraceae bacterium]|jgi:hypothetical protein|nr:hypothetical protein [Solirubrobacteraceae bacterium]